MPAQQKHWFPAKRHGWGWGLPAVWQGWVVLAVFSCLLLVGAFVHLPRHGPVSFVIYSVLLCVLLVAVCWVKGERPRWRRIEICIVLTQPIAEVSTDCSICSKADIIVTGVIVETALQTWAEQLT